MSTRLFRWAAACLATTMSAPWYPDGQDISAVAQDPCDCRSPACGGRDVVSRGQVGRRLHPLPIDRRPNAVVPPIPGSNATPHGDPVPSPEERRRLDPEREEEGRLKDAGAERAPGNGLLHEGRPEAIRGAAGEALRDDVPGPAGRRGSRSCSRRPWRRRRTAPACSCTTT